MLPTFPTEIHPVATFDTSRQVASAFDSGACSSEPASLYGGTDHCANSGAIASMSPIQRTERAAIIEALQRSGGHVIDAAKLLGLGQATVYRKIKQYHIPHQRRRRRRPPK